MGKLIEIGISDLNIAACPDTLITYALGSCVGICLYDKAVKIAGMSHILLPDSAGNRGAVNVCKYADTAVAELISRMEKAGCKRQRMTAKIAGGANMFGTPGKTIGDKNVDAVKEKLQCLNIRIVAEDTGGNFGRTIEFSPENGELTVKAIAKGIKVI